LINSEFIDVLQSIVSDFFRPTLISATYWNKCFSVDVMLRKRFLLMKNFTFAKPSDFSYRSKRGMTNDSRM